jgi:hypothetical protein
MKIIILDFTTTFTTGDEGSGIGTVTIDANYANAFFALVSNTSLTVTIINEEPITPPDPTNSVTPLVLNFDLVTLFLLLLKIL